MDIIDQLRFLEVNAERVGPGAVPETARLAREKIERLQQAKRAAGLIADERSKENVALRAALQKIADFERGGCLGSDADEMIDVARDAIGSLEQGASLENEDKRTTAWRIAEAKSYENVTFRIENERLQAALMLAQAWMLPVQPEMPGQEALKQAHATVRDSLRADLNAAKRWAKDSDETNDRLRAALRVNALRWQPHLSHDEIDAEIDRAVRGEIS